MGQARKACKGFALVAAARLSCCRVASRAMRCENIGVWPLLSFFFFLEWYVTGMHQVKGVDDDGS